MFDSGARQPVGGEGGGGPVSVVPPGPKLALNGPGFTVHIGEIFTPNIRLILIPVCTQYWPNNLCYYGYLMIATL